MKDKSARANPPSSRTRCGGGARAGAEIISQSCHAQPNRAASCPSPLTFPSFEIPSSPRRKNDSFRHSDTGPATESAALQASGPSCSGATSSQGGAQQQQSPTSSLQRQESAPQPSAQQADSRLSRPAAIPETMSGGGFMDFIGGVGVSVVAAFRTANGLSPCPEGSSSEADAPSWFDARSLPAAHCHCRGNSSTLKSKPLGKARRRLATRARSRGARRSANQTRAPRRSGLWSSARLGASRRLRRCRRLRSSRSRLLSRSPASCSL